MGMLGWSKESLFRDKTAAFVYGLLQPLVREVTYGRVHSLMYHADESEEVVYVYLDDGTTRIDVDVTEADHGTITERVLGAERARFAKEQTRGAHERL